MPSSGRQQQRTIPFKKFPAADKQQRNTPALVVPPVSLLPAAVVHKATSKEEDIAERLVAVPFSRNRRSNIAKLVDKLFDYADTDGDGTVDWAETYEMVLQIYVQLNRQAPIPPPSRERVYEIFRASDSDKNNRISRQEFTRLANVLGRRALTRLVAHKIVTLIGAPLLATLVVSKLKGRHWLVQLSNVIIPERFTTTICTVSFWRTALVVLFVATLGNIVITTVNFILDFDYPQRKEEKAVAEPQKPSSEK